MLTFVSHSRSYPMFFCELFFPSPPHPSTFYPSDSLGNYRTGRCRALGSGFDFVRALESPLTLDKSFQFLIFPSLSLPLPFLLRNFFSLLRGNRRDIKLRVETHWAENSLSNVKGGPRIGYFSLNFFHPKRQGYSQASLKSPRRQLPVLPIAQHRQKPGLFDFPFNQIGFPSSRNRKREILNRFRTLQNSPLSWE